MEIRRLDNMGQVCFKPYKRRHVSIARHNIQCVHLFAIRKCRLHSIDLLEGTYSSDMFGFKRIPHLKSWTETGVIVLPHQTMHYCKGNPSKLPYICIVWYTQMNNLMTPCEKHTHPGEKLLGLHKWVRLDQASCFFMCTTETNNMHMQLPQDASVYRNLEIYYTTIYRFCQNKKNIILC